MRRFSGSALALLALAILGMTISIGAGAKPQARADLKVQGGTVGIAGGKLSGSFTVKNQGSVHAGKTKAALTLKVSGKVRVVKRFKVRGLDPGASKVVKVSAAVPSGLPAGTFTLRACADLSTDVKERSEGNNCRQVGKLKVSGSGTPISSVPTDPIPYETQVPLSLSSSQSPYFALIPETYDPSHQTPVPLFIWMHGCGGDGLGDVYDIGATGSEDWIAVSLGGRDGDCWDVNSDSAWVLAAITDIKTHFNINPRRVIIGGYSSGGDLAYRTAFYNSNKFAGLLAENTSPFRDTGSSQADSIAAAHTKFNIVHLAHKQDDTYPKAGVEAETNALKAAGFPLTLVEVDGEHYNNQGDVVNGSPVPGTSLDLKTYLLSHIDDGWTSP